MSLADLEYDDQGLIPVIAQDAETGEVRMVAWANQEAVRKTLDTRKAHFFSRSRGALWLKGETSGNTLGIQSVWADCDGDTLLYLVDPAGPSCHTGAETCFFRRLEADGTLVDAPGEAAPTLLRLERALEARKTAEAGNSYTKTLLDKGAEKIDEKLREEASELGQALIDETNARVASESADLAYHMLVGLILRRVSLRDVLEVLSNRFGTSGHDEKASR